MLAFPTSFETLEVLGWPGPRPRSGAEASGEAAVATGRSMAIALAPRAAAAAAALRRWVLASGRDSGSNDYKDVDVLDDCAKRLRAIAREGDRCCLQDQAEHGGPEMLALSAGVAMYAASDGLTGAEAVAAFRAGQRVRSLLADVVGRCRLSPG